MYKEHIARKARYIPDFGCAPRGSLDSTRATCGPIVYDSGCTTHGSDVLALPVALLASPSSYVRATDIASTSSVTVDEGRTGGSSSQPSSDDHVSKAGLPTFGRQTHLVSHLGIHLVVDALLRLCRPRRSELALHHGRRVCCLDRQQHLGSCPPIPLALTSSPTNGFSSTSSTLMTP
jgi:hypothetical protein